MVESSAVLAIYALLAGGLLVSGGLWLLAAWRYGAPVGPHELLLILRPDGSRSVLGGGYVRVLPWQGRVLRFRRAPVLIERELRIGPAGPGLRVAGLYRLAADPPPAVLERMAADPAAFAPEGIRRQAAVLLGERLALLASQPGFQATSAVAGLAAVEAALREADESEGLERLYCGVVEVRS